MKSEKNVFFWVGWQGVGIFSWFMWIAGSWLSYWGFVHAAGNPVWWVRLIAAGLSIGINFVEFMLNRMTLDELIDVHTFGDVVLRAFGLVCYSYDIYTNVLGFLGVVGFTTVSIIGAVQQDATMAIFAIMFGVLTAVGPEPLYIRYLQNIFPYPGRKLLNSYYSKSTPVTQYQKSQPTQTLSQHQGGMSKAQLDALMERARQAREEKMQ